MNLVECFRVALRGLNSNKMRTALTMLGIIVGVAVVIVVVAIGEGAKQRVTAIVNSMGNNLLNITPDRNRLAVGTAAFRSTKASTNTSGTPINSLTLEDVKHITTTFRATVDKVAPQIDNDIQVKLGDVEVTTEVAGTTIDYPDVKNSPVGLGRFFTEEEVAGVARVCVLGTSVVEHLTGDANTDLTGQSLAIGHQTFVVIGIMATKGSAASGQDQDDIILIPVTTAMRRVYNSRALNNILVRCTSRPMMALAQEQVSSYLRNRHHLLPPFPDNDDFRIRNQLELLKTQQSVTETMTNMLSAVAVISLVVGGIGIMNIMLVSVTERTREIGIRKAIGANPRDILWQFLIESVVISVFGGLIGIGVGVGGSMLLTVLAGWSTIVSFTAIAAAVVVSAGVGIFFGIYPAKKAADLNPIDALRFE